MVICESFFCVLFLDKLRISVVLGVWTHTVITMCKKFIMYDSGFYLKGWHNTHKLIVHFDTLSLQVLADGCNLIVWQNWLPLLLTNTQQMSTEGNSHSVQCGNILNFTHRLNLCQEWQYIYILVTPTSAVVKLFMYGI